MSNSTSAITSSTSTRSSSGCSGRAELSLHDERAARSLLVVLVEELVAAGLLGAQLDDGVLAGGDDLLDVEAVALQLHRIIVEIAELDHDRRVGGRRDLGGIELLVLVTQRNLDVVF